MFGSVEKNRHGLLIDIGSGSIGFAIVTSNDRSEYPEVLWSTREYLKSASLETLSSNAKTLISTLTDMALTIQTKGLPALQSAQGAKAAVTEMQVTVSAPWSYSVNRTVTYQQPEPFTVTDELIADIAHSASQETSEQFAKNHAEESTLVAETSHAVLDIRTSGYRLPTISKQVTDNLQLSHNSVMVYKPLVTALQELNEKIFGAVPLQITSGITALYYATKLTKPHVYDVCLLQITAEATEIGVVRDGALIHCSHTALGSNAIAREISHLTNQPITEVLGRLDEILAANPKDCADILRSYEEKLVLLFSETSDTLSIPRTIYAVASDTNFKALGSSITAAAKRSSKTTPSLLPITEIDGIEQADHLLTIPVRFFHTSQDRDHFHFI